MLIDSLFYILLNPKLYAKYKKVKIGENCRIRSKNWGSEPYLIEIGNHVHITKGVEFVTHDGSVWIFRNVIPDIDVFGKIRIGDNTYIGNNATILPGVHIGKNCIIGANSTVTKSIPDNCVIAGSPARYLTSAQEFRDRIIKYNAHTKGLSSKKKQKYLLENEDVEFLIKPNIKT